jgi:carboxypeptidase C (cathepsin A)
MEEAMPTFVQDAQPDPESIDGATARETAITSRHATSINGRSVEYEATAGTVIVRDDDNSAVASMFYTAYTAVDASGEPDQERPLTFLFNGGPGSASLWLNIGGFGPKRAPTKTPRATPPAPYVFGDNPYSLLDTSDLVFLDAIGTGYSRTIGDTHPHAVWGVDQDIDAFTRAIIRYLTISGRWNSPRYLFGESYGTTRAAGLVLRLQNQGLDINGVVLLSSRLNWASSQPGVDGGFVSLIPSFAATAHYHGLAGAGEELDAFLDRARAFARGPYAAALNQGDQLDPDEEQRVADTLAGLIGLPVATVLRYRLRIDMEPFRRELRGAEGLRIGRFDTRFTADDSYALGTGSFDPATDDAATAGVNSAHLSAYRHHLAHDLGFHSELQYRPLYNMVISRAWDWSHKAPGFDAPLLVPNTALDLSAALRRNPHLRVLVSGGVYDIATPFFGAETEISALLLSPEVRSHVSFSFHESGHMTFVDENAIARMKSDLVSFYALERD